MATNDLVSGGSAQQPDQTQLALPFSRMAELQILNVSCFQLVRYLRGPLSLKDVDKQNNANSRLYDLPPELILIIGEHLTEHDLIALGSSSRKFRAIFNSQLHGYIPPQERRIANKLLIQDDFLLMCKYERSGNWISNIIACSYCRCGHPNKFFSDYDKSRDPEVRVCLGVSTPLPIRRHWLSITLLDLVYITQFRLCLTDRSVAMTHSWFPRSVEPTSTDQWVVRPSYEPRLRGQRDGMLKLLYDIPLLDVDPEPSPVDPADVMAALEGSDAPICAHQRTSERENFMTVNGHYLFGTNTACHVRGQDCLDVMEEQGGPQPQLQCPQCDTTYWVARHSYPHDQWTLGRWSKQAPGPHTDPCREYVVLSVRRVLGRLQRPGDPVWLRQLGL